MSSCKRSHLSSPRRSPPARDHVSGRVEYWGNTAANQFKCVTDRIALLTEKRTDFTEGPYSFEYLAHVSYPLASSTPGAAPLSVFIETRDPLKPRVPRSLTDQSKSLVSKSWHFLRSGENKAWAWLASRLCGL